MATELPAVGKWQVATVTDIRPETARVKTLRLALTLPSRYMAGQHYSVKLTAPDGYMTERSYSVASPPDDSSEIEFTIERLQDGEVSEFLHDEVMVGDTLEVRGPVGGWFVWDASTPALLIGGGTGIVRYPRPPGHLTAADLTRLVPSYRMTYICGSTPFAEAATSAAMDAGATADTIRLERFGPTS